MRGWLLPSRFDERRAFAACKGLIGGDPTAEFVLPAGINLFGSMAAPVASGTDVVVINGVNRATSAAVANEVFLIGYFERETRVQALAGVTLYIDKGRGNYISIGNDPSRPGRVMFGSRSIQQGNETLLTGTENDVQLSTALAALTGDITIGADTVTISGDATIAGATALEGTVSATGLVTADGATGVLWQDNSAARVVKVST